MNANFTVQSDSFEGPLEALLNLIEERKLSVSEVSLAEVCDSYLAYVEKLPGLPLGETAQFVLVASTLLLIKSRTLLPMLSLSEEERESVAELERRLARYALVRKSAKLLRREWGKKPLVFAHRAPQSESVFAPGEAAIASIANAAAKLVSLLPKPEKVAQALVAPVLKLEDVIVNLKERLRTAFKARFSELTKSHNRVDKIVYFLGVLELVRAGSVSVTQERLFDDILLSTEGVEIPKYGA